MKRVFCLAFFIFSFTQLLIAQNNRSYKVWNPAADTTLLLEGQGWPGASNSFYQRFPARAEHTVREDVWSLSKNTAGIKLCFKTDADEIIVKYKVTDELQFPHMPATGVSGIDLYIKTSDGKWLWSAGKYNFADTIIYRFSNLSSRQNGKKDFHLYLPLYNSVQWMTIEVPENNFFKPRAARKEKPIIVYGTSIAQGACATRPGLAWTALLERKLNTPVINLGFSGNGRMEKPVINLIAELDAKIFVLDCLPNMVATILTPPEVKQRLTTAVDILQSKRPGVPILFCEHDGLSDEALNDVNRKKYQDVNNILKDVFDSLTAAGKKNIYLLKKEAIGQDLESMVDGVHPNDMGMMRYATAYEKKINAILRLKTKR